MIVVVSKFRTVRLAPTIDLVYFHGVLTAVHDDGPVRVAVGHANRLRGVHNQGREHDGNSDHQPNRKATYGGGQEGGGQCDEGRDTSPVLLDIVSMSFAIRERYTR